MTRNNFILLIFVHILLSAPLLTLSQESDCASNHKTSEIIQIVSKDWKIDSLGDNGYRTKVFKDIRCSKIDPIDKKFLFDKLGKPSTIQKFYSGNTNKDYVGFRYYVLNMNENPKLKPFVGSFIEFVFDSEEKTLQYIDDGDYCM